MYTLLLTQSILGATIVAIALLILFVLSQNIRPLLNKLLVIKMLGTLAWAFSIFVNLWLENTLVESFIFAFAAMALVAQLSFALAYPGTDMRLSERTKCYMAFISGLGLVFMVMSFVPGAVFSYIEVTTEGYTIVYPGWLSNGYALFVFTFILSAIIILSIKWKNSVPHVKEQTLNLLLGFIFFFITTLLTNSILPVFFNIHFFNGIGPVFSLLLAAFIVHNIFKYKFLEIRTIIQRGLIYTVLSIVALFVYIGLVTVIGLFAEHDLGTTTFTAAAITTLIGIFTVPYVDMYLRKITHPLFFKGQFDYSQTLFELSQTLNETLSVRTIIDTARRTLTEIFGADHIDVVLNGDPRPRSDTYAHYELRTNNGTLGELLLDSKKSDDAYTSRDTQMLLTLANQIAIAIERAQLYEAAQKYNEELEQKVLNRTLEIQKLHEYQKQMLDELSHGLKLPLTVIINELEMYNSLDKHSIEPFKKSIQSLSDFISKLLQLSILESPHKELNHTVFNLSDVLSEIVTYSEISLGSSSISFSKNIFPDVYIKGDARKIAEVMHIFFHNAVRYRKPSKLQHIHVSLTRSEEKAYIAVSDTGIGIAAEHLPNIFKRFYRVRDTETQNIEGSGLGLPIAYSIAVEHKGNIEVESKAGEFTKFIITLPLSLPE